MASFGCYDNSDFIATRIITNFHLYLNKYNCGGNFSKCLFMVSQSMLKKNFTGIDPEKLYRATFICQYGLCCCIVWPSFLFDCFVKIWATCKSFLGKWFTAPPGKKLPLRLCSSPLVQNDHLKPKLPLCRFAMKRERSGDPPIFNNLCFLPFIAAQNIYIKEKKSGQQKLYYFFHMNELNFWIQSHREVRDCENCPFLYFFYNVRIEVI